MVAALIGAAGSLGASALGNAMAAQSARRINDLQLQNQRDMYDKQIELANSAHQREVSDLRLAGLNPILSASGSGAGAPAAPSVDLTNPDAGWSNFGDAASSAAGHLGKGVERMLQRQTVQSQVKLQAATADNTAIVAERNRIAGELAAMELEYYKEHPDVFARGIEGKNSSGNPLVAGQGVLSRLGHWVGDSYHDVMDKASDTLRSIRDRLSAPSELTVGGESYSVPSARSSGRGKRPLVINVEYDGKGPKRRHH